MNRSDFRDLGGVGGGGPAGGGGEGGRVREHESRDFRERPKARLEVGGQSTKRYSSVGGGGGRF